MMFEVGSMTKKKQKSALCGRPQKNLEIFKPFVYSILFIF
jgi:hypothetical protein